MSTIADPHPIVPAASGALGAPVQAEAAAGGESGMNFSDLWRTVKRHKLMIAILFVLFYGIVIAATIVVWRYYPTFSASALLQLRPPQEEAFSISDPLVQPLVMEQLLRTEANKILREDVLQDVLSQEEIKQTSFYQWYEGDFNRCLEDLKGMLSVGPVQDTQLISVSLAVRDKKEAKLIVQTLVERYLNRYRRETETEVRGSLDTLRNTHAKVIKDLEDKQKQIEAFRSRTDVGAVEAESAMVLNIISNLYYQLSNYEQAIADLRAQLSLVEGIDPRELPIGPEDRIIVEADPLLRWYRQQVEALDIELDLSREHLTGRESRSYKLLDGRRNGYFKLEQQRREELLDDLRERRVEALRQELVRYRNVQQTLQEQVAELEAKQSDLDRHLVAYMSLLKDEERLQKQLESIDEHLVAMQHVAGSTPSAPRLQLMQSPREAVRPTRPNLPIWLGGGLVLALGAAVGLAFLRDLTDKAIRTPIDVARFGRLSVLGIIPELDDEQADIEEIELATRQAPHSLIAEAFRQVRANLVFSGPRESQRTLLITSAAPGSGKTATAINLAVSMAQAGEHVLLIDCNFRRPSLRQAFKGTRPEGLSNILIGQARLEDLITTTELSNLHVLTSGPMPPTPAELLGSSYMRDLLAEAKTKYDRVVLDGPPVLLISDGLVLATQTDAVLLVARAVENTKGALKRARDSLEKVRAHVVGAVLNGVRAQPGGYYRRQYREFYEYSSDEIVPQELPGPAPRSRPEPPPEDEK